MSVVCAIALPEYVAGQEPEAAILGARLDGLIVREFPDRRLAIRGIGMCDHPGRSLEELTALIRETGTDRYDPDRKGVHQDFYAGYPIDLFATPCFVAGGVLQSRNDPGVSVTGQMIADFYHGALADRGYSVRLDLLLIYDREQLVEIDCSALWPDSSPEPESSSFAFRFPERKRDALLGIVLIQ